MRTEWITITEYQRRYGCGKKTIMTAIEKKTLKTNGKTGRDRRVDGGIKLVTDRAKARRRKAVNDVVPAATGDVGDSGSLEYKLLTERVKKLENENKLLVLKQSDNIKQIIGQAADIFCEAYSEAFAPLKQSLTVLKLERSQVDKLRTLITACNRTLSQLIKERLQEIDG